MPSIHPELRLAYIRDDGDGGVEFCCTTSTGQEYRKRLTDSDIAFNVEFLAGYVRRRFQKTIGQKT